MVPGVPSHRGTRAKPCKAMFCGDVLEVCHVEKGRLCVVCPRLGTGRPAVAGKEEEGLPSCCWAGRKPASPGVTKNELGRGFTSGRPPRTSFLFFKIYLYC